MNNQVTNTLVTSPLITKQSLKPALHGGDIISASAQYKIGVAQWIDLSTGLNPDSYPIDGIPASAFTHLPYLQPEFIAASRAYYHSSDSIALIGSQMLIQNLPQCVAKRPVLLPSVGYDEHRQSWQDAGFDISFYPAFELSNAINYIDQALQSNPEQHLVIINPNNPSGLLIEPEQLIVWANKLPSDCYVIVDEAFIDMRPQMSVLRSQWPNNMLVLRSFGKYFGLAGIRIGFAFCKGALKQKIEQVLGLWMINGPAQYLAGKAMRDTHWQDVAINSINSASHRTQQLFEPLIAHINALSTTVAWETHQGLFSSYQMAENTAIDVQHYFASNGILLRVIKLPIRLQTDQQAQLSQAQCPQALLRVGVLGRENQEQHSRVRECITALIQNA